MPLDWATLERQRTLPPGFRGVLSSALMKSIRLAWPEEALYGLRVMERGKAGGTTSPSACFARRARIASTSRPRKPPSPC
jgi:hypothetical protein